MNLIVPARTVIGLVLLFLLSTAAASTAGPSSPPTQRRSVVVLGNSLAAGYGLEPHEAFPALLQKKIDALGWDFEVVNAGVSGDTSAGGRRRLDWVLRRKIDVLVLELGGNDGLRGITPAVTQSNLQSIIERTRQKHPQAQIVIAGLKMPPNMGLEYGEAFEGLFANLARVNGAALIPFLLEGVGGKPELNLPDRIHPTAQGHRIVAENVWRTLRPVLEKVTRADPTHPWATDEIPDAKE
jgi:acyl-CoA thioesterase-1